VIIQIGEAKDSPKRKKKLRKQINGKCNNIGSADKKKSPQSFYLIEKNGSRFFRRPKLTLSRSAEGKEGRAFI
jgi:hypothetical protein